MSKLRSIIKKEKEALAEKPIILEKPKKRDLLKVMGLSMALDFAMTSAEIPLLGFTFGSSVIVEEIIEYFLSGYLSKYGLKGKMTASDKMIGFIPVPGVTGIAVRCAKELIRMRKEEKLMAETQSVEERYQDEIEDIEVEVIS